MAVTSNRAAFDNAIRTFARAMAGYVRQRLYGRFGAQWWDKGVMAFVNEPHKSTLRNGANRIGGDERAALLEPSHFLRIIPKQFDAIFAAAFDANFQAVQTQLQVVANARNQWAHELTADLRADDVGQSIYAMVQLLEWARLAEAKEVEAIRRDVLGMTSEAPPTPAGAPAAQLSTAPGELPYWWQVCEPHDGFKDPGNVDDSLFAATLGGVHAGTARAEYLKPDVFLGHTYFTENLKQTILDVASRLNRGQGPAVTEMQTPFGGGKTHALLTLYHIFKNPTASLDVPGVREALGSINVPVDTKVVVFDGMLYDTDPTTKPNGATVFTLPGELAYQVDSQLFDRLLSDIDGRQECPGMSTFRQVLEAAAPCLFLIDELVSYLVKLRFANTRRTTNQYRLTVQFLQEMLQEASNVPGIAVLISLPKSRNEFGGLDPGELQRELQVVEELQVRSDRVVSKRTPVNDDEIYTLMSKRLFKQVDAGSAERVAKAYREVHQRTAALYEPLVLSADYLQNLTSAYPLHPDLIDVLYKKWSAASDFPRTRAVLQLLASIVADQWTNHREAFTIQPSHVNLERERIRTRIVSAAGGGGWDAVVASDIIGGDAHADAMDQRRGGDYQRNQVCRGIATSLLMHSLGGGTRRGALVTELRASIVAPNLGSEYLDVLDSLEESLHYVHREGQLLRFDVKVNIFRRIAEAAERQPDPAVAELMRTQAQAAGGDAPGFRVICWGPSGVDLSDQPVLTIALLEPKYGVSLEGDDSAPAGTNAVRQLWDRPGGANGKRDWRNALILVAPDKGLWATAEAATRDVLAFGAVLKDIGEGRLEVSQSELKDLQVRERDKRDSLHTAIVSAYRWVFHPGENDIVAVALAPTATRTETVARRVVERLAHRDYGTPKVMPALSAPFFRDRIVTRIWTDETKAFDLAELKRRFLQWTYLPMLPDAEAVLRACIREGLNLDQWAVAIGNPSIDAYTALIETPQQLDGLTTLFDGTAALVRGSLWAQVKQALTPEKVTEGQPELPRPGPVDEPRGGSVVTPTPTNIPAPPKRHSRVRLTVSNLSVAKTGNLQMYLFKVLQEQDAAAELTLSIDVRSGAGVSGEVLDKRIVEGLEQLGIDVKWEGQ